MKQVTAGQANQRFSELLSTVETGEEIIVTKHGRPSLSSLPIARLY